MAAFPRFADLPRPDSTGLPLANGTWGPDDQIGTLNHITPAKAAEAAKLVKQGRRFNLDLPLHLPFGLLPAGTHARRLPPKWTLIKPNNLGLLSRDDKLDDFYLQGSTQWDGLTHIGDPTHGFYNGVPDEQVHGNEGTRNGIENVADFCIFTRGVLIDIEPYFASIKRPWGAIGGGAITPEELAGALKWQGTSLSAGDVLLVRMGWLSAFIAAPEQDRVGLFEQRNSSGLAGGVEMWEYLWDNKVAAVATDTVAVEIGPRQVGQPSLHWAIGRLGITLGEMFFLDELAAACAKEKRYDFLFSSKPLNLRGGVGSPPNAMAVW